MLNKDELKSQIQDAVIVSLKPALKIAFEQTNPSSSELFQETAENFAETAVDIFAEPFAISMAGAIDYYVRSISIFGNIVTTGSPTTQQANIQSPMPMTNGYVPNSLGIN